MISPSISIVIMGVCGAGKTTFGKRLAEQIDALFVEGDDLHPAENIEKMSKGIALTDADRTPWLNAIVHHCNSQLHQHNKIIIACSALRKTYRQHLRQISGPVFFVHLDGSFETISTRMMQRQGHFMPEALLRSQFTTLESPGNEDDVLMVNINLPIEMALDEVKQFTDQNVNLPFDPQSKPHLGLVGLGVMGQNLAENFQSKGYLLQTCEVNPALREKYLEKNKACHATIEDLVQHTEAPRCLFLLIKAGAPVDNILRDLLDLLAPGDTIIDLGNSHYQDTERRCSLAAQSRIHYIGCGISGGAEGAREGPALMPGGHKQPWPKLAPIFRDIAAKFNDSPCVSWVGADGAGHFVKMVHNGIEYADMQLIAEVYHLLRDALSLELEEIATIFEQWNQGPCASYLLEISATILKIKEPDGVPIVDRVLDKAGQKGTGGWTTEAALRYGSPATLITQSVFARVLSSLKSNRMEAAKIFKVEKFPLQENKSALIEKVENAYYFAKIINYAEGFRLLHQASKDHSWQLSPSSIAENWRAGCIIRGAILDDIANACHQGFSHQLYLAPKFVTMLNQHQIDLRTVIKVYVDAALASPCFSAALNFFDSMRSETLPANLIQAQRDYFGAHSFERTDEPEGKHFHGPWLMDIGN